MKKHLLLSLIVIITLTNQTQAQDKAKIDVKYGQLTPLPRQDDAMKKWRENRFGQFIHWGLYAIPGGVWEGKTYHGAAEWLKSFAKINQQSWDSLQYQFNPKKFNPAEWAKMAKNMGVKYVTITTKHHEGFCLWPSKFTDFDIEATPYIKDLLGEFIEAYNKEGIDVNLYYSVLDWHHPDWRYKIDSEDDKEAFQRLMEYTENQLLELIERYPSVKGFWFDGTWDQCWKDNGEFSYKLEQKMKALSPGLIINSRMRADEHGSRHFDSNGVLMGDYESGYERRLPVSWDVNVTKNDWECCMTIPENQWGYHKDWSISHIKSTYELLEMLAQCTSQNGNFLLNFGPKGDGSFREEEEKIAKEIGSWMKVNGTAIYGCEYAGLEKQSWGYFTKPTKESNKIYMLIFNMPISGEYKVKLNKGQVLKRAFLMSNPNIALKVKNISKKEYLITNVKTSRNEPFTIVLEFENKDSKKIEYRAKT